MFSGCLEPPSGEHSHKNSILACSPGAWNHPPENIHSSSNVLRASGTTLRRTSTQKCVPRMFSGCLEPPSGEHSHRNDFQECSPGVWNHHLKNIHRDTSSKNVLPVSGTTFRRTSTQKRVPGVVSGCLEPPGDHPRINFF